MSDLDPDAPDDFDEAILGHLRELIRARDPIPLDLIERLYTLPAGRPPAAGNESSG